MSPQSKFDSDNVKVIWPINSFSAEMFHPKGSILLVISLIGIPDFEGSFLERGFVDELVKLGVESFSLIGQNSDQMHDALDMKLEENEQFDILTTWHTTNDFEDVSDYVFGMISAGERNQVIIMGNDALVHDKQLIECIKKVITDIGTKSSIFPREAD